ncbi:hypothetical protein [Aquitalea magnusonii]|uniref:hypothetical protein n=1 Tax=Aquitalea magnusonii TaxID=332411 RepID=UPI0011B7D5A4|nr:hypothetical protein [Aquitalea magnusonii]
MIVKPHTQTRTTPAIREETRNATAALAVQAVRCRSAHKATLCQMHLPAPDEDKQKVINQKRWSSLPSPLALTTSHGPIAQTASRGLAAMMGLLKHPGINRAFMF